MSRLNDPDEEERKRLREKGEAHKKACEGLNTEAGVYTDWLASEAETIAGELGLDKSTTTEDLKPVVAARREFQTITQPAQQSLKAVTQMFPPMIGCLQLVINNLNSQS